LLRHLLCKIYGMNGKYIKIIIYTSLFSAAYGGFFYQRSTSMHSVAAAPAVAEDHVTASSSLLTTRNTYIDENETANSIDADDVPDVPSFRREKRTEDKKAAKQHSSSAASTAYSGWQGPTYSEQVNYSQEDRSPARFTATSRSNAGLSYAPMNTSADNSVTSQNLITASSNTSNDSTTKTFVDPDAVESDGSEFLPDGSSQQDLFNAKSKNPRVYTIKDYQTADISCAPGYDGASSPHAQLIRGLKGC